MSEESPGNIGARMEATEKFPEAPWALLY